MRPVLAAIVAAALTAGTAAAADLDPSPALLDRAAAEGGRIAARHAGYPFGGYILHQVRDARALDPADGAVDAVVLATPIERTRHAAYIAAYGGRPIDGAEAYRRAGFGRGRIAVIIFAHGATADDESFVRQFSHASLSFAGGGGAIDAAPVASETSETSYPLAPRDRERMVATITYRFDLAGVAGAGDRHARLRFVDSTGKPFDLSVDLAAVR